MSFVKRNYIDGETVITAENLNDIQDAIIQIVPDDVKQVLLQIASKVAYIDEHGQDYYDALEAALYPEAPPASLVSISAVYTQSGTVYDTDSLDSLKADLVVTAHFDDSSTEVVTAYTLSGTLEVGTSTITVSYGGKTTTFNVTVSAPWWSLEWTKADGGFPYSVDATHWRKGQQTSDISFVDSDGIRINGTSGVFSCYPTGHETSSSSTYEIKCKFATMPTVNGILVRLGNGTIGIQVMLGNGGISMDNGATLISGVSITTGVDYIVKAVCDTSGTCYVYLDGVQIWSGSASAIGNKKNYVMMTTASSSIDAYISEIRFG